MKRLYFKGLDSPANIYSLYKLSDDNKKRDIWLIITSRDIYTIGFCTKARRIKLERHLCQKKTFFEMPGFNEFFNVSCHGFYVN